MTVTIVDFVLVWEVDSENDESKQLIRDIFEKNLNDEGLSLERDHLDGSKLHFTKINAPMEVLRRYTEILKLRMPMKEVKNEILNTEIELDDEKVEKSTSKKRVRFNIVKRISPFSWFTKYIKLDETKFPPESQRLTAIYSRDKEYLFDINEHDFFKEQVRARIIDFIISRIRFSDDPSDEFAFGIQRLIEDKIYTAAYPLHDGDLKIPGSVRNLLFTEWAYLSKFYKHQPLDTIKEYFGVQIGLYFAWLGFYTQMLIPVSFLGFLCFLYGVFTLSQNTYSEDICNKKIPAKMCPTCGHLGPGCSFWDLEHACLYARITHMFDNEATVLFAVLMSFWAAIFHELWKRYSSEITHKWDLSGLDKLEEQPRLEYLTRLKKHKKLVTDIVDLNEEPHVSFWKTRVPYSVLSLSIVLLMVTLAGAVVVGIIAYRVSVKAVLAMQDEGSKENKGPDAMFVTISSACLNLVLIVIFNNLYTYVAQYLTELELHRTQTEFDDSLTLKIYALQFVNFYSSIFYIAFFKGRFGGAPDQFRMFLSREDCGPAGCMADLCVQLAIIMVGKQFVNAVIEMTSPLILKWFARVKLRLVSGSKKTDVVKFRTQWARDVNLLVWHSRSLFSEYLEMVLQYGFITIFVAAFPLAPFFALLNNIMEMRLDATKMLMHSRRPVGLRVKDIGIWSGILQTVSRIAVISNALIIAFTSSFIPKLVHTYETGTLDGFLLKSLTSFNTTKFNTTEFNTTEENIPEFCYYAANHYNHTYERVKKRYTPNTLYWEILTVRLAFVVIFQNVVSIIVLILKAIIPDVPKKLQQRIRLEAHLTNEIIIKQETLRAREMITENENILQKTKNRKRNIEPRNSSTNNIHVYV